MSGSVCRACVHLKGQGRLVLEIRLDVILLVFRLGFLLRTARGHLLSCTLLIHLDWELCTIKLCFGRILDSRGIPLFWSCSSEVWVEDLSRVWIASYVSRSLYLSLLRLVFDFWSLSRGIIAAILLVLYSCWFERSNYFILALVHCFYCWIREIDVSCLPGLLQLYYFILAN